MHFPSSWSHLVKWCIACQCNTKHFQNTLAVSCSLMQSMFFEILSSSNRVKQQNCEIKKQKTNILHYSVGFEQLMCTHLGGTAANCSISPHLGTCVLVKVLLHLWDSSVLGILPKPITQRPSITPMRLAVIIISIMLPQWAWFTSLDMAPALRQGVNIRLFATAKPISPYCI